MSTPSATDPRHQWARLFALPEQPGLPLKDRLRLALVQPILEGRLPPGAAMPPSRELSRLLEVSRNTVVAALLASLLPALEQFEQYGLAPFLPRYATMDVLQGRAVRVEEAGVLHDGVACGLAEDGALRVNIDGRETCFHAGEVSVRAA